MTSLLEGANKASSGWSSRFGLYYNHIIIGGNTVASSSKLALHGLHLSFALVSSVWL